MNESTRRLFSLSLFFLALFFGTPAHGQRNKGESCVYQDRRGTMFQADGRDRVPAEYRSGARCIPGTLNMNLAAPSEISLDGSIRSEKISTSLGEITLRWPRSVEQLFGRSPLRAMTDAARTVARAVKTSAFPPHVQNMSLKWDVVFMDENLPAAQIPFGLISGCHPGWMTPPSNIYIVAQRVAAGCGGQKSSTSVADSTLAEVLVHELGHAVEFQMLNGGAPMDRMRAEGFATWFALFASQYSAVISESEMRRELLQNARYAIKQSPTSFIFQGTALDYARAAMYFIVIADRRGLPGLMDVYKTMGEEHTDFFSAVNKRAYWDRKRLDEEVVKAAK